MRILTLYPNCSLGGMTSVYLNRCLVDNENQYDFIFLNDKGGRKAYEALESSSLRIVRKDRLNAYMEYLVKSSEYEEIRITSLPEVTQLIKEKLKNTKVIYEFHTSSQDIILKELDLLNLAMIDIIWVPSVYLQQVILANLSEDIPVIVNKNIANYQLFNTIIDDQLKFKFPKDEIPIFWIGRFDKGKNYKDFLRVLYLLPNEFVGYLILSLEDDPTRFSEALGELQVYGLRDRVKFLLNLSQEELANLYKSSYENKGMFCSTSLAESFGYGVLEAAMAGLPVVSYRVGGLEEHLHYGYDIKFINVGDLENMAEAITNMNWEKSNRINSAVDYLSFY